MRCRHCGGAAVCSVCNTPFEPAEAETMEFLDNLMHRTLAKGQVSVDSRDDRFFLIVARGHRDLFEQIQTLVGDMGWVRVIEDRRQDQTLLPREGREGTSFGR